MNKYELLEDDTITLPNSETTLYRIRALRDFDDVKKGDLGGYIEAERNLSHEGDCWLYQNSMAYELANVKDNAKLYDSSQARGRARVGRDASLQDNSIARGYSIIRGATLIQGESIVEGSVSVYGNVIIRGNSIVKGDTRLRGDCIIADAYITSGDAVVWFSNVGSERGTLTVYCGKTELLATRGCFKGTLNEFYGRNAARPFSLNSARISQEYVLLVQMARLRLQPAQEKILSNI